MSHPTLLAALVATALSTACYHATVVTGLPEGNQVVEQQFARGFVFGLVPYDSVETKSKCTDGVAKVETQQSFRNGLVGILTLGMFTPWQITVTCAARSSAITDTMRSTRPVSPDAGL